MLTQTFDKANPTTYLPQWLQRTEAECAPRPADNDGVDFPDTNDQQLVSTAALPFNDDIINMDPVTLERKKQTAYRTTTSSWVASGPHAVITDLALFLSTVQPHACVMRKELYRAGEQWTTDRAADEAKRAAELLKAGVPPADVGTSTDFTKHRLVAEYLSEELDEFLKQTYDLMTDASLWEAMPLEATPWTTPTMRP